MTIDSFEGPFGFLSNFYPAPVEFEGVVYPTSEHAYHAAKTLDLAQRALILRCATPSSAKRFGQRVSMREDWEAVKIETMEAIVERKFRTHPDLRVRLLATGTRELIEGNFWGDRFWGICGGQGRNELGKVLMRVRERLRSDSAQSKRSGERSSEGAAA